MLARVLTGSRYLILVAVFGSLLAAVAALAHGAVEACHISYALVFDAAANGKKSIHGLIEVVDLFLLGTVFYLVALGLYELFIDANMVLPPWLKIDSLEQLKAKLLGVITLSLAVLFLSFVADWDGSPGILYLGGAIALVIAAATWSQKRG